MRSLYVVALLAVHVSFAQAGTADDELSLKNLYQCKQAYVEKPEMTYDADKNKLDEVTLAVKQEIAKKYSARDAELMSQRALALVEKNVTHSLYLKFCSEMMARLLSNKRGPMKSYLIRGD